MEGDDEIGELILPLKLFERSFNVPDDLLVLLLFGLRDFFSIQSKFQIWKIIFKRSFRRNIIEAGFTAIESNIESARIHSPPRGMKDDGILDNGRISERQST